MAALRAAFIGCAATALLVLAGVPGRAGEAGDVCRHLGTDDRLRPLPPALLPQFLRRFGPHMPADYALATGWIRCADGKVLGCSTGANLPCGKADTRRDIPGADAWCRAHHDPAVIPAYVTGHATLYAWRCRGGRAVPVRQVARPDRRGFVAGYWKRLD